MHVLKVPVGQAFDDLKPLSGVSVKEFHAEGIKST